jgi:predicted permease
MRWLRKIGTVLRRDRLDAEMSDEMRHHVELQTELNLKAGMSTEDARYAAVRQFGNVASIQEQAREVRRWIWLEQLGQDLRHAGRSLGRNPAFATAAVFTLALGIGANTTIFSLIDAVLLKPLPVRAPEQLVIFSVQHSRGQTSTVDFELYERFLEQAGMFSSVFAYGTSGVHGYGRRLRMIAGIPGAEAQVEAVREEPVSGNFFSALGLTASVGRLLVESDDEPGKSEAVVVISHAFWERRFGRDPGVVGRKITLEDVPFTIVGVAPPGFVGLDRVRSPDLWRPLPFGSERKLPAQMVIVARLKNPVALGAAQAEANALFKQLRQEQLLRPRHARQSDQAKREWLGQSLRLLPGAAGQTGLADQYRELLFILMAVVGLVLMIACANLANLLLARGAARRQEIALRHALGASRFRLIRQLFTESMVLAVVGGAFGLILAVWGTHLLLGYLPAGHVLAGLSPDIRVFSFCLGLSLLTGAVFGLPPAFRATSGSLVTASAGLRPGGSRLGLNEMLVVAQVALSLTLLTGAGMFGRSLTNLRNHDPGYDRTNLILFTLEVGATYNAQRTMELAQRILTQLEEMPGIRHATIADGGIFGTGASRQVTFTAPGVASPEDGVSGHGLNAGPGFFATTRTPLLMGREFRAGDKGDPSAGAGHPVVIISESTARKLFGETNPVGRSLVIGRTAREIVGVAKDLNYHDLREVTPHVVYFPLDPEVRFNPASSPLTFAVRTVDDVAAVAPAIREAVRQLEPRAGVAGIRTMEQILDETLLQERVIAWLSGGFSVFALVLAALGLFGLLSYSVVLRTQEIGVRMALGANPGNVLWLVVRKSMLLVLAGMLCGVATAAGSMQLASSLLFGVSPVDPLAFSGAVLLLLVITVLATWLPARRAAKVDPMIALRAE